MQADDDIEESKSLSSSKPNLLARTAERQKLDGVLTIPEEDPPNNCKSK
jgi:hypothetical protein